MEIRGKVAIVLGAGASFAARVGERTPPLDGDFLDYAVERFSAVRARGVNKIAKAEWNDFKRELSRAGLEISDVRKWRLEQLSTFLEARSNLRGLQLYQGQPRKFQRALRQLEKVIAYTLWAANGSKRCPIHTALFKIIRPAAVLSFNYDLIADQSLRSLGYLDLNDKDYRGAKMALVPNSKGKSFARPIRKENGHERRTRLIKLHGSIHYSGRGRKKWFGLEGVKLPTDINTQFDYLAVPTRPLILPPVAAKMQLPAQPFKRFWELALDELHDASTWIIWGYSFPTTDTVSHVLFKTALQRNRKNKRVIVVNPDRCVVEKIRTSLRKVSVLHYSSIEALLLDLGALTEKVSDR
jgi:hypothetical protein